MNFFHPIQQSALHIYHSALPLSPKSSEFPSRTLHDKTRITRFHGRPDVWGIVVRTITASSKRFTRMTTFGHRIATACDDGTVGIYNSITGVLRLSLSPKDPVQAIRGSPDGSILFCAHKTPSITAWDMQTGGLIHTLVLERNAEDIAVSFKGRYLGYGLSGGSVEVWDVANKMEVAVIWTSSSVTRFCWLEPEERLAVSTRELVDIYDIVTGTVLQNFTMNYPIQHLVYSQGLDKLAVAASSADKNIIGIIDPQTETHLVPTRILQKLTCFTFSQITEELVCGTEIHGLLLFNLLTRHLKHIEYPDTMSFVSSLPNGTVAANFAVSGVQLLNLDGGYSSPKQPTLPALTVHAFDQGRIIAILLTSGDHIVLMELATMKQLLNIPAQETNRTATDRTHVLCASLDNRMAVHYSKGSKGGFLRLWKFRDPRSKWAVKIEGLPSIGRISPSGAQLVTFHDGDNQTCVCVWDTQNGQLKAKLRTDPIPPLDFTFDSETRFYSNHDTYRMLYFVDSSGSAPPHHFIACRERLPLLRGSQRKHYDVDDTCEWVVSDSKRICWIPPGYIGSVQPSYCWAAGNSLLMAGQDGRFRVLTFREPN